MRPGHRLRTPAERWRAIAPGTRVRSGLSDQPCMHSGFASICTSMTGWPGARETSSPSIARVREVQPRSPVRGSRSSQRTHHRGRAISREWGLPMPSWTTQEYDRLFRDFEPTQPVSPAGTDLAAIATDLRRSTGAIAAQWNDARSVVLGSTNASSAQLRSYLSGRGWTR